MAKVILPSLLNEELILQSLQNLHQLSKTDDLNIKTCDFKIVPANGEHFCSEIYRVEVVYQLNHNIKKQSCIVFLNELYHENVFNKFHAKCLLSAVKPLEFYVLENLNSVDYYCANRSKGLDLEHAKILMQKIAKFHAATMLFNQKYPEIVKSLLVSQFEVENLNEKPKPFTYGCLKYISHMIKSWPTFESLADKLFSIIRKFNRLAFEAVNSKDSRFNVINHGDLWINNFLYKYNKESGKPIDVLFVDFQLSFWGSCGVDLNTFFYSSLELNVLRDKRPELIQCYYENFKQTLCVLNFNPNEIPTLEDVLFEIKRCEFIGFYIALCEFPMIALDKSQSNGIDCNIFNQPEKLHELRKLVYLNPRVVETLKYCLNYFEDINLL